jgi:hypothetical protein
MLNWVVTEHAGEKFLLEMPHLLYYEFAKRSFFTSQDLKPDVKAAFAKKSNQRTVDFENVIYANRLAMNDILIYSALSLEAYINYYAMRYDIPFHKDFEKSLSTVNKWKVYPNLKTRKSLDGSALKLIKKIFKLRDDIVHPKPERIRTGTTEPPKGTSAQAQLEEIDKGQLIIELNSIYEAMFKIDKDEKAEYEKKPWFCILKKVS